MCSFTEEEIVGKAVKRVFSLLQLPEDLRPSAELLPRSYCDLYINITTLLGKEDDRTVKWLQASNAAFDGKSVIEYLKEDRDNIRKVNSYLRAVLCQ